MLRKYYLAYGSNLNLEQMKKRCHSFKVIDKYIKVQKIIMLI